MNEIHATFFVYRKDGGYGRPHQYAFVLKEQNNPDSRTLQAYILNAGSCELTKLEALDNPTRGQEFGFEPDRNYNPIVLSRYYNETLDREHNPYYEVMEDISKAGVNIHECSNYSFSLTGENGNVSAKNAAKGVVTDAISQAVFGKLTKWFGGGPIAQKVGEQVPGGLGLDGDTASEYFQSTDKTETAETITKKYII